MIQLATGQRAPRPLKRLPTGRADESRAAYAIGPTAIGSIETHNTYWAASLDSDGKVWAAPYDDSSNAWGEWVEILTILGDIRSISLDFDIAGQPIIGYLVDTGQVGVWSRITPLTPTLYLVEDILPRNDLPILVGATKFSGALTPMQSDIGGPLDDAFLIYQDGLNTVLRVRSEGYATRHQILLSTNYQRLWPNNFGGTAGSFGAVIRG